jgi:hypothetical protein
MTQPNTNQQTAVKPPVPVSQAPHPTPQQPFLTEARAKEIIMETLIQLKVVPRVEKKKVINLE